MQREGGRGKGERQTGDDRGGRRHHIRQREGACDDGAGQRHLRGAKPEYGAPKRPQSCNRKFQPYDKQEENDAEFGYMKNALLLMQEIERIRSGYDAGREITKDGAEPQPVEDRNGDRGGAEIGRRLNKKFAVACRSHAWRLWVRLHAPASARLIPPAHIPLATRR